MSAEVRRHDWGELARALTAAGPAARLYLQPIGLLGGRLAGELTAEGGASWLAGGPLAMTSCLVLIRNGRAVRRIAVAVADLAAWAAAGGTPTHAHVAKLLQRLAAPRPGTRDGPRIMGVVNVTPDSFSDGGAHLDPAAALAHCRTLAAAGADILDIGGESTRPGAVPVSPAAELARVTPVLAGLQAQRADLPSVLLSVDTRHAAVMRGALAMGADIINDVTGLTGDPDSLAVAAQSGARIVLMHMQGTPATMNVAPAYDEVTLDVFDFLEARIAACVAAGIARERLIVDPGIGFGKRGRENRAILRALPLFHGLGCPVLLGLSRKGLGVGEAAAPKERLPISLAAAMHALACGVQMLRVHDVAETRLVVALWRKLAEEEG